MIDPHVHLRDWAQRDKETVRHGLEVAWRVGLSGVFEMPNTAPTLTDEATIQKRIALADQAKQDGGVPIFHGLYAGLTVDEDQIAEIVKAHRRHFPRVVGFKLFAGHSTGRMGVVTEEEQRHVWNTLARLNYRGVVAVHAESEHLLRPDLWEPARPQSHSDARPPEAELSSVNQQIRLAGEAGYRGSLHIVHVTTPEALSVIRNARPTTPFTLRAGVTPHHLLLSNAVAQRSPVPEWNVNPPLRDEPRRRALWDLVLSGAADWLESDHAPHTWNDKVDGASGLPGIPAFRLASELLRHYLPPDVVEAMTHRAVVEAFAIDPDRFPPNPQAETPWDYERNAAEYPWDPYRYFDADFLRA